MRREMKRSLNSLMSIGPIVDCLRFRGFFFLIVYLSFESNFTRDLAVFTEKFVIREVLMCKLARRCRLCRVGKGRLLMLQRTEIGDTHETVRWSACAMTKRIPPTTLSNGNSIFICNGKISTLGKLTKLCFVLLAANFCPWSRLAIIDFFSLPKKIKYAKSLCKVRCGECAGKFAVFVLSFSLARLLWRLNVVRWFCYEFFNKFQNYCRFVCLIMMFKWCLCLCSLV